MAKGAFWKADWFLGIALTLLMLAASLWIPLSAAAGLLLIGYLLLIAKRLLSSGRREPKPVRASAESSRLLALAFQGQGQLDQAFDKFRQCPMDDGLMENLYNLGLDFERQRQFSKAEAVFRAMAEHDSGYRDIAKRLTRDRQLPETVVPTGGQSHGDPLTFRDAELGDPQLGPYRLERELGKGAMGVVYQGRDPKINRVVAIKTMALAQEFDADELADVKQRFFREAETAGRLNHPNIVTMYEAGEEHDLAYIAMEFLNGCDLLPWSKPGPCCPCPRCCPLWRAWPMRWITPMPGTLSIATSSRQTSCTNRNPTKSR
ncbi:protein kinase domain-containing protein [Dechloromonas sp. A34]|uniref:protein kinase domain-containing protein n=1 Tax=Dechloromonas sp. A34 TaxID=447588 RepID=UPI0022491D82|nr:protein kinase [Dechloromonas sp. A34]